MVIAAKDGSARVGNKVGHFGLSILPKERLGCLYLGCVHFGSVEIAPGPVTAQRDFFFIVHITRNLLLM